MESLLAELPYTLIRSNKRKTLGIQVKKGEVIVRAPFFVDEGFINDFIREKSAWLQAKVNQQNLITEQHNRYQICDNGVILYLGHEKQIKIVTDKKMSVSLEEAHLICAMPSKYLQNKEDSLQQEEINLKLIKQINLFYKSQALELLPERVAYWQQITGLFATELTIRKYKARWGSCSSKGKVNLNYLLMACPAFVIDYVIVHELCHLKHLDHSPAFWRLVERFFPKFQQAKQWLKQHQFKIMI